MLDKVRVCLGLGQADMSQMGSIKRFGLLQSFPPAPGAEQEEEQTGLEGL
jgi:hypothetical protein